MRGDRLLPRHDSKERHTVLVKSFGLEWAVLVCSRNLIYGVSTAVYCIDGRRGSQGHYSSLLSSQVAAWSYSVAQNV